MTRQQIRIYAQEGVLMEILGTPGYGSPFMYNVWITQATDELCEDTDILYGSAICGIVAGQSTYCMPNSEPYIYKIKGIFWTDSNGNKNKLRETTTQELDVTQIGWRNANNGSPICVVAQGGNQFRLYPTPDTTLAGGLLVEGYAKPAGSWSGDTAECPIPGGDSTHMSVVWGVCKLRAEQFPAQHGANLPLYMKQWSDGKGRLETQAIERSEATRHGDIGNMWPQWGR